MRPPPRSALHACGCAAPSASMAAMVVVPAPSPSRFQYGSSGRMSDSGSPLVISCALNFRSMSPRSHLLPVHARPIRSASDCGSLFPLMEKCRKTRPPPRARKASNSGPLAAVHSGLWWKNAMASAFLNCSSVGHLSAGSAVTAGTPARIFVQRSRQMG